MLRSFSKLGLVGLLLASVAVPTAAFAQAQPVPGTTNVYPFPGPANDNPPVQDPRVVQNPNAKRAEVTHKVMEKKYRARGLTAGAAAAYAAEVASSYIFAQLDLDYWGTLASQTAIGAAAGCVGGGVGVSATGVGIAFSPAGCGIGALLVGGYYLGDCLIQGCAISVSADGKLQGRAIQEGVSSTAVNESTITVSSSRVNTSAPYYIIGDVAAVPLNSTFVISRGGNYYKGYKLSASFQEDATNTSNDYVTVMGSLDVKMYVPSIYGHTYDIDQNILYGSANSPGKLKSLLFRYDGSYEACAVYDVCTSLSSAEPTPGVLYYGDFTVPYSSAADVPVERVKAAPVTFVPDLPFAGGTLSPAAMEAEISHELTAQMINQAHQVASSRMSSDDPRTAYDPNDAVTAEDVAAVSREGTKLRVKDVLGQQIDSNYNPSTGRIEPAVNPLGNTNPNANPGSSPNPAEALDQDLDSMAGEYGSITDPITQAMEGTRIAELLDFNISLPPGQCPTFAFDQVVLGNRMQWNSTAFCEFSESQRSRIDVLMTALISFALFLGFLRGVRS